MKTDYEKIMDLRVQGKYQFELIKIEFPLNHKTRERKDIEVAVRFYHHKDKDRRNRKVKTHQFELLNNEIRVANLRRACGQKCLCLKTVMKQSGSLKKLLRAN